MYGIRKWEEQLLHPILLRMLTEHWKRLDIVFCENVAAVERLLDRNGHRRKEVDEGESVSWRSA